MADHHERDDRDKPWPDGPIDLLTDARAWSVTALVAGFVVLRRFRRTVGSIPGALPLPARR